MFIASAGLDQPLLNASVDSFIRGAGEKNVSLDFINHPGGHLDVLDDDAPSHAAYSGPLSSLKPT
jgi:hypothetical protein